MSYALASSSILENWNDKHARLFGEQTILLKHRLADTGLFTEEALGKLIERCKPEHYNLNTMGHDKSKIEWRAGEISGLSGREVIDAIRKGRMWLNVHRIMDRDPVYQKVLDQIFNEFEARVPGLKTKKRNFTLLISSPNVQVYYHFDIQGQSLWQISGKKRVYVYPTTKSFLDPLSIEKVLMRETEEEVPYEAWYDDYAQVIELEPGHMAHWPLYAPHRVENHDCLNISVTTEHWTRETRNAFAVNYGNGVLRRTLGLNRLSQQNEGWHVYPKAAVTLAWKRLKFEKSKTFKHYVDFRADPDAQNGMIDIEPYHKAA